MNAPIRALYNLGYRFGYRLGYRLANLSIVDHYCHARAHCGCGRTQAIYRAVYAQTTGRWPW